MYGRREGQEKANNCKSLNASFSDGEWKKSKNTKQKKCWKNGQFFFLKDWKFLVNEEFNN